ncbi:MAG: putative acetyltransferase [Planctomycetota bacterium]
MEEVTLIRDEIDSDCDAVRRILESAFPTGAEAKLVDQLRTVGKLVITLVASLDDQVVGHIAFSPIRIAGRQERTGVGLAPVSVNSRYRKRGVAARLVRAGLERAKQLGYSWAVVLGDPGYYGRFGFAPASDWALNDTYGGGSAFQALELQPAGIPAGGGTVSYSEEFNEL